VDTGRGVDVPVQQPGRVVGVVAGRWRVRVDARVGGGFDTVADVGRGVRRVRVLGEDVAGVRGRSRVRGRVPGRCTRPVVAARVAGGGRGGGDVRVRGVVGRGRGVGAGVVAAVCGWIDEQLRAQLDL